MFSGIVEAQSTVLALKLSSPSAKLILSRPLMINDLKIGDSLAVNGVCLTLEAINQGQIEFTLGPETLKITAWDRDLYVGDSVNLERSLKAGDRVHGHFVSGHVDAMGTVMDVQDLGDSSRMLHIEVPPQVARYVWPKGSVAVNGVSLTVNGIKEGVIEVGLIPETLRVTNLARLVKTQKVCIEVDGMSKAIHTYLENRGPIDAPGV